MKNTQNQKLRSSLLTKKTQLQEEPENIGLPDLKNLADFVKHIDRLAFDENIDGIRNELTKLRLALTDSQFWHQGVICIDRFLYDDLLRQESDLGAHSLQGMVSVVLRDFLMDCFLTQNNPKLLEHIPLKSKSEKFVKAGLTGV